MPEEQLHADVQPDPAAADTQSNGQQQSPDQALAGHDDAQNESQQPTSEVPSEPAKGISDADLIARREEGKLKKTQEENARIRQELEGYKQDLESYKKYILKSPDRVKEALKEIDNYDDTAAEQYVQQLKQKNPQLWAQQQQAITQAAQAGGYNLNPETIKQLVAQGVQEERQRERAEQQQEENAKRFFEILPDLHPAKYPDEDSRIGAREVALRVGHLAETYRTFKPDMSVEQALQDAYKFVTGKSGEQIEQAREQGRIEGMLARNNDNASNISPVVSGSQTKKSVQLTEAQRTAARRFNLTDEEYAEYM